MRAHRIPSALFDELARGGGGAETVRMLRAGQLSKHVLLIRAVTEVAASRPDDHAAARLDQSYALLAAVQQRSPDAFADVLLHPQVGAWAMHCLRRLRGSRSSAVPLWTDLAHLGGIAAAAAVRGNHELEVAVPVREGAVALPTLGLARVPAGATWDMATARRATEDVEIATAAGDTFRVPADPHADAPGWCGLRRLHAVAGGQDLGLYLDDVDPFRACYRLPVSARLGPSDLAAWRQALEDAWSLLVRQHASHAKALSAGLRSLVPLHGGQPGGTSATSTDAFGAVARSAPAGGTELAVTLVHEFQHAKLAALLDLVALCRPGGSARYYAPWRDDPRPLGALLQGTYAHLGVTAFWRTHRLAVDGRAAMAAHFEFSLRREQTSRAVQSLAASGELTTLGRRFVAGMEASLASWWSDPVPAEALALAREVATEHRVGWLEQYGSGSAT